MWRWRVLVLLLIFHSGGSGILSIANAQIVKLWDSIGQFGCGCLDSNGVKTDSRICPRQGQSQEYSLEMHINGVVYCYPRNYGESRCKAWDQGLPPFCDSANSTAEICNTPWCYVGPECSGYTADLDRRLLMADDRVSLYSADTCQRNLSNSAPPFAASNALNGTTLRVYFIDYADAIITPAASVRLVTTSGIPVTGNTGVLQMQANGVWKYVCSDEFTLHDRGPNIACQELGYANGSLAAGTVVEQSFYEGINCAGNETRLALCPRHPPEVATCQTHQGVLLTCSGQAPNGKAGRSGFLWEYLNMMREESGTKWLDFPELPLPQVPSRGIYEDCLVNVELGALKACIGIYYITAGRLVRSPFTISLQLQHFQALTTGTVKEKTGWTAILSPFSPFSLDLWLLVFAINSIIGVIVYMFETECDGWRGWGRWSHNMCDAVYNSVAWYWSGGVNFEAFTFGSKILLVAYAFFIMLLTSAYTANMASDLVQRKSTVVMTSMDDVVTSQLHVCAWEASKILLKTKYSTVPLALFHDIASGEEALDNLKNGVCDVFLEAKYDLESLRSRTRSCDMTIIRSTVMSVPIGFPISSELVATFNYYISLFDERAEYRKLATKYKVADPCAAGDEKKKKDPLDSMKLNMNDLQGAFATLGAFIVVASWVRVFRLFFNQKERGRWLKAGRNARLNQVTSSQTDKDKSDTDDRMENTTMFEADKEETLKLQLIECLEVLRAFQRHEKEAAAHHEETRVVVGIECSPVTEGARHITPDAHLGPSNDELEEQREAIDDLHKRILAAMQSLEQETISSDAAEIQLHQVGPKTPRELQTNSAADLVLKTVDTPSANDDQMAHIPPDQRLHFAICREVEAMFSQIGARCMDPHDESIKRIRDLGSSSGLFFGDLFVQGFDSEGRITVIDVFIGADKNVAALEKASSLNFSQTDMTQSKGQITSIIRHEVFGIAFSGVPAPAAESIIQECAKLFAVATSAKHPLACQLKFLDDTKLRMSRAVLQTNAW